MTARIVLADDHVMIREGLRALLEREGYEVVAEASDGREALRFVQDCHPEVVVLDWVMPVLNGLDAAKEIRDTSPRTYVIIMTAHNESQFVLEAMRAGIHGYILKTRASSDLLSAIREVLRGNIYLSPGVSRSVVDAYVGRHESESDPLTGKQRQILQMIAEGKSTKEIADILQISTRTAESHRNRLMQRLGIHDVAGLVRYAIRNRIIQP